MFEFWVIIREIIPSTIKIVDKMIPNFKA